MQIKGLQKLTLLDYPGHIACTVFVGGCNLRCPFCHNGSLAVDRAEPLMSVDDFLTFLDSRSGRLTGMCVSGGEPTLQKELPELLRQIKSRGFSVKLDTNGTNPDMLEILIAEGLVDYIAMDIKNSPEKYFETAGLNAKCTSSTGRAGPPSPIGFAGEGNMQNAELILEKVKQSADLLMQGRVDFEFRTTLVRELHDEEDIVSIGKWLTGDEKYFLQTYRNEGDLLVGGFTSYNNEETERLLSLLRAYIPNAEIR